MIECLIVDDELDSVELLSYYAKQIATINLISATTNPITALNLINGGNVQLIFCDIQMPVVSGLDIAKAAKGKCKLIFVTAYKDFALEGFEHDAVDYLLKPVTFLRFLTAFQKAEKLFALESTKAVSAMEIFKDFDLSKREIEVIDLLVKNNSAKEIANNLHIALSTANKHISNIYKKLNVTSKYEIISNFFHKSLV